MEGGPLAWAFFRVAAAGRALVPRRRRELPSAPRRIAVVRLGGVGDAVLATPILGPLRERYPGASLEVVCWRAAEGVFRGNPVVHRVLSSPLLDARTPRDLARSLRFREWVRLRGFFRGVDLVIFLVRTCSVAGFLKAALVAHWARKAVRVGIDTGGRAHYLDLRVEEGGGAAQHEVGGVASVLKALGAPIRSDALSLSVPVSSGDRERAGELLGPLTGRPFAALHLGSSQEGWRGLKRFGLELWEAVARGLHDRYGLSMVLLGSHEDRQANFALARALASGRAGPIPVVDLSGRTALMEVVAVVERARLFVGTDSGVAHLAACAPTPGIALFAFTDFVRMAPWSQNAKVMVPPLACAPCQYTLGYERCENRCCFDLDPEEVLRTAGELLAGGEEKAWGARSGATGCSAGGSPRAAVTPAGRRSC
ncbi:MAG: glycosyltransferase family 9 protein [Thermodesulfobacteriota bacterium]